MFTNTTTLLHQALPWPCPLAVGGCCASCQHDSDCNAFTYCSQKGGCLLGDGTRLQFGHCELLRDDDVAAGRQPAWADWTSTNPLLSGYVAPSAVPDPPAAGAGRRLLKGAM